MAAGGGAAVAGGAVVVTPLPSPVVAVVAVAPARVADPRELVNKLKAHVDEGLFQSFERSDEGGIDLNSPLGNALAAGVHAVLRDAVVVTLEAGRMGDSPGGGGGGGGDDDDDMGLLLLSDEEHAAAQSASVVVTYAVMFDSELAAAVVAQHAKVSRPRLLLL